MAIAAAHLFSNRTSFVSFIGLFVNFCYTRMPIFASAFPKRPCGLRIFEEIECRSRL